MSIDKSNPNTRRLINYWVRGEGAARIGWGTNNSFAKCVAALSDKVRDPKGLCAELHKEATGEWPAEKGVESALETSDAMLAAATLPRGRAWRGLIAPYDKPTGDGREFANGALTNRPLPLPLEWRRVREKGHDGAVTVGIMDSIEYTTEGAYASGWLFDVDPKQMPRLAEDVAEAAMLMEQGVLGPSVDVDNWAGEAIPSGDESGGFRMRMTAARISAATLVSIPAFAECRSFEFTDAEDTPPQVPVPVAELSLADDYEPTEFAVNGSTWAKFPIGDRDALFDADDAITRLIEWSGGRPEQYRTAFLWIDKDGNPASRESYRLPIADIVNGRPTLVPHAVYAAAALLSGAHGGLPNIPDQEKEQIREVVTRIYDKLRDEYADPRIMAPWERGGRRSDREAKEQQEASVNEGTWEALLASGAVRPPAEHFRAPRFTGPTKLRVDDDGRVFGHLATWGTCHIGIGNGCVDPPHSTTGYAYFCTGEVVCDDGSRVAVGKITLGTGHADRKFGYIPAAEHYDNTGNCVAVVAAGEDEFGIWVAGSLVPGVGEERVAELRRSPLSGDWRRVRGGLELVGALAVNTPGFPIVAMRGQEQYALVAAGIVTEDGEKVEPQVPDETGERYRRGLAEIDEFLAQQSRTERAQRVRELLGEES